MASYPNDALNLSSMSSISNQHQNDNNSEIDSFTYENRNQNQNPNDVQNYFLQNKDIKKENDNSSSELQIQEIRIGEEQFRNNVRQLLMTQGKGEVQMDELEEGNYMDEREQEGQPIKGSFLRDMEILGKTISFQQVCHNIYEDEGYINSSQPVLNSIQQVKNQKQQKLALEYYKIQSNYFFLESKYIVDFSQLPQAKQKNSSKQKCHCQCHLNKKFKKQQKFQSQFLHSSKSKKSSNNNSRISKKKSKMRSQIRKSASTGKHSKIQNSNINLNKLSIKQQQFRRSQLNSYLNFMKNINKKVSSPLKKVGYNSMLSQAIKTKCSDVSSFVGKNKEKQKKLENNKQRRKDVERKLKQRTKI